MLKELQNKNTIEIECQVTVTKRAFYFHVPSSLIQDVPYNTAIVV